MSPGPSSQPIWLPWDTSSRAQGRLCRLPAKVIGRADLALRTKGPWQEHHCPGALSPPAQSTQGGVLSPPGSLPGLTVPPTPAAPTTPFPLTLKLWGTYILQDKHVLTALLHCPQGARARPACRAEGAGHLH